MSTKVRADLDLSAARILNLQAPSTDNEPLRRAERPNLIVHAQLTAQSNDPGNDTIVIFNNEVKDTENAYNNATGIFTAPTTGLYIVTAQVRFAGGTATLFWVALKQGSTVLERDIHRENVDTCRVDAALDLTAGQTLNVTANYASGTAIISGFGFDTFLKIVRA